MTDSEVSFLKSKFPEASFETLTDLSASLQQTRCLNATEHVHSALLQAVNFDKMKDSWYQTRFHDQVKSCDALYYHDSDYYLLEFKTGKMEWLDVFRKIYDSIIGLMEQKKLTLEECRAQLNVILIANNAEDSPNKPLLRHLQSQGDWSYAMNGDFVKTLKPNDIRRLTNFLVNGPTA